MDFYLRSSLQALLNRPLAMQEGYALSLRSAILGELNIGAKVRGASDIPEVDARTALAAMNGISVDSAGRPRRPYALSSTGIAMISVTGRLVRSCDIWDRIFGGVSSYEDICEQILFAQEDSECRGIFMHHNCLGGNVDGLLECMDFVAAHSARNGGKPIFGYAGDYSCSAAFMLLAACDKSFCGETGQVGSIGVIMMHADLTKMFEKDGVEITVFRSAPGKALGQFGQTLPEEEIERVQANINYLGGLFEKRVARYVPTLTQSAVAETLGFDYMGPRAKAIGLVTDVLSMPEAWAKLERRIAR